MSTSEWGRHPSDCLEISARLDARRVGSSGVWSIAGAIACAALVVPLILCPSTVWAQADPEPDPDAATPESAPELAPAPTPGVTPAATDTASPAAPAPLEVLQPTWTVRARSADLSRGITAEGNTFVIVDKKGGLAAWNAETGKLRWTAKAPRRPTKEEPTRFALQSGIVAVVWPGASEVVGLDGLSGDTRWTRSVGANVTGIAACGTDAAVVVSHRADGGGSSWEPVAHAMEPATGKTLWMERAAGPVVQGIEGWVFTQDRKLGSDYKMMGFRCQTGESATLDVGPGNVWRIFDIADGTAVAEVCYNSNTVFDVCALPLAGAAKPPAPQPAPNPTPAAGDGDKAAPAPEPAEGAEGDPQPPSPPSPPAVAAGEDAGKQCRDLSHLAPAHYRLRGACQQGDEIHLVLAPPLNQADGEQGRAVRWHWKRNVRLGELPDGTANVNLFRRGDTFASFWAGAGKDGKSWVRFWKEEPLKTFSEVELAGIPVGYAEAGPSIVVLTSSARLQGIAWPPGDAPPATPPKPVKPRRSAYRLIGK